MTEPKVVPVTVVVPTWRRPEPLACCIDGILGQRPQPEEVLVIGRDSDTAAKEVVRSHSSSRVHWVGGAPVGHVGPLKSGLAKASQPVVAFLDDDVVPEQGWLHALIDCLSDPTVVCAGGRIVTPGFMGRVQGDAGQIRWYGKYVGNLAALETEAPIEVAAVPEGNSVWRTAVLRSLEFDPRLDQDDASMFGLDLTLQARELGGKVLYTSRARVRNLSAPRDPSLAREDVAPRMFIYNRNYTLIALHRFKPTQRLLFVAWTVVVGERRGHGLITAAGELLAHGRSQLPFIRASVLGKWAGARAWRGGHD